MKKALFSLALCLVGCLVSLDAAAQATNPSKSPGSKGTPKIQFETNFFDFGKITAVRSISGIFKFKNVGDAVLKVDAPLPGCECTESKVKPDTLAPGQTGEIIYTIKLDHTSHNVQKYIRVHSNDPKTPSIELTMQYDYTPVYEVSPITLWMTLPAGKDESHKSFTLVRTDKKPMGVERLTTSQKWMSAEFDSSFKSEETVAKVNVTVHRPSAIPSQINGLVEIWGSQDKEKPMQSVNVVVDVQGELAAIPPQLYWVISDLGKNLTQQIELRSVLGHPIEVKSATSNIKGLSIDVVPKETGKRFDLNLKFAEIPKKFSNGKVIVETSLASLPRLEIPVTVAVPEDP
jgi:hypothetical protein